MTTRKTTKFTGVRVFDVPHDALAATLMVDAGSGSVTLEIQIDTDANEWITAQTFTADGVHKVEANGCTVRVTCAGDAAAAFVRL